MQHETIYAVVPSPGLDALALLFVPVKTGETITVTMQGQTDQSDARARLDVHWYDSAHRLLGTAVGDPSDIAPSTWEPRTVTVVATADGTAYCLPQMAFAKQPSTVAVGATARATGAHVQYAATV